MPSRRTRAAQKYIRDYDSDAPFALVLSWGPPHNPYDAVSEEYRRKFDPDKLRLRPNVPPEAEETARTELAGYYAHINALDEMVGALLDTIEDKKIAEDTIFVFWSDHGDMLGSQGQYRKQRPWDESIRVPLLIRYPAQFGAAGREIDALINVPDLMPTLLSLCGTPIPDSVEGNDYSSFLKGEADAPADSALIACYHPFGEYAREADGREYRGLRTKRYTYARDFGGDWLLYDNLNDPYQLEHLIEHPDYADVRTSLSQQLDQLLQQQGDEFLPGMQYIEKWGYVTDEFGTVVYRN